jgi:hypothetical protein
MYRQPPPDQNPGPKPGATAKSKDSSAESRKPDFKKKGEDWTPVALKPEALELVDLKLADDSTCIGAWTGRIWWTRDGTVNPVQWRKRPDAVFASLILK